MKAPCSACHTDTPLEANFAGFKPRRLDDSAPRRTAALARLGGLLVAA